MHLNLLFSNGSAIRYDPISGKIPEIPRNPCGPNNPILLIHCQSLSIVVNRDISFYVKFSWVDTRINHISFNPPISSLLWLFGQINLDLKTKRNETSKICLHNVFCISNFGKITTNRPNENRINRNTLHVVPFLRLEATISNWEAEKDDILIGFFMKLCTVDTNPEIHCYYFFINDFSSSI